MQKIIAEAKFYTCQKVVRVNGIMSLTHQNQAIRVEEEFFLAHPAGGAEVEGRIISPSSLRGGSIHVDLFRDRTRGIFTLSSVAINHELDYFPLWSIWYRQKRIMTHLGTQGWYTDNQFEVRTEHGIFNIRRNHDTFWGPRLFRGYEHNWGPVTIMIA